MREDIDNAAAHGDDDALVALMVDYQSGSLAAFERLYALLAPAMRAYFRAALRSDAQASDLAQDTFLELHRARRTYQPGRPVRAWAFGIARHVLLRHRNSERRRARHERAQWQDQPLALETAAQPAVPLDIDMRDIDRALRGLSPAARDAWWQHHVEGRRFADIAQALGIATAAARLRASRASAALRRALGLEGDPDHG